MSPESTPEKERDELETAVDQAIASCGGGLRATIRAPILADDPLERQVAELKKQTEELKKAGSRAFVRRRFETCTG